MQRGVVWGGSRQSGSMGQGEIHFCGVEMKGVSPGLSLKGEGWGFPPATKNVAPGYFQRGKKRKRKRNPELFDPQLTCFVHVAT